MQKNKTKQRLHRWDSCWKHQGKMDKIYVLLTLVMLHTGHFFFFFFLFLRQNSLHFSLLECLLLLWGFERFLRVSGHLPTPRGTKEPTLPLYWEACIYEAHWVSITNATKPLLSVHSVPGSAPSVQCESHNLREHGYYVPILQTVRLKRRHSFTCLKWHSSKVMEPALKTGPYNSGALTQQSHPQGMEIRWRRLGPKTKGKKNIFFLRFSKGI